MVSSGLLLLSSFVVLAACSNSPSRDSGVGSLADLPSRIQAGLASATRGQRRFAAAAAAGAAPAPFCNSTQDSLLGCGNVACVYCVTFSSPTAYKANATCTAGDRTGSVPAEFDSAHNAVMSAMSEMFLSMRANLTGSDCSCSQTTDAHILQNCSLHAASCQYLDPAMARRGVGAPLGRGQLWDLSNPKYTARSKGWDNPEEGYNTTDPSSAYEMIADGISALRRDWPADHDCVVDSLPPLVIIPGLTSSSIVFELDDSPTPKGLPWCNRTTEDWMPLWPLPMSVASKPAQLLCWGADMQVQFDPAKQSFGPQREGMTTSLVDFGNFSGIPGFDGIIPIYSAFGWELGKNFFGAPFDWRLPGLSQTEFFTKLKALIETAYAANNNQKVALWAFSFGPQFTLSFLHRMTQAWKDQYIHKFIATSPVWSGAPAALITYTSGYGTPQPPTPPQCKAFTVYADTIYTGPLAGELRGSLADCCTATEKSAVKLFNYYSANTTCHLVAAYVGTVSSPGGMLGYDQSSEELSAVADRPQSGMQLGAVPLTPALTRIVARASPALMWTFPRRGTDPNTTWTAEEPLLMTPSKNYSAFDYAELLDDLGLSDPVTAAQLAFLSNESDLTGFASPGVDTFVTYGDGIATQAAAKYSADFSKSAPPTPDLLTADGDGLVPSRSSIRGLSPAWQQQQAALGKQLFYKAYHNQPHAGCFAFSSDVGNECFRDVMALLTRGAAPSTADE